MGCQVRLVHELVKHSRLDDAGNAGFAKEYKRESETGLFDSILFFRTVGRAALIAYGQSMVWEMAHFLACSGVIFSSEYGVKEIKT